MGSLIDSFGRTIDYLRLSVTDRCDFRCIYCMAEEMRFAPRRDLLSFEEMDRLSAAFIARGIRRLRVTGGEPLMRKGIMVLFRALRRHLDSGALDEVTLTTNGSRLGAFADELADCGVRRINVSIDTLDPARFAAITRRGSLAEVLAGVAAATRAGISVKVNAVALKGVNEAELPSLMRWCHAEGHDLTLIETMPLGEIGGDRLDQYLPLALVRERLASEFTLEEIAARTGGPARYVRVRETGGRLGFITPMSDNFCAGCNRVRVTSTGRLYMCLGQDDQIDLRAALRASEGDDALNAAIATAMVRKPRGHDFIIAHPGEAPALARHMSVTGG